jgi:hypothetical protein
LKLRAKSVIVRFAAQKFIRPRDARSRGSRGTKAVGFVTLPPLVLAPLPLGWDQRTKKTDRTASSNDLLGILRRRGKYAARSMARQEQLRVAAAPAVAL